MNSLNGRIRALEDQAGHDDTPMTAAERDRRLQIWLDRYEERGWRPTGQVENDQRFATLLYVMVRAADRAVREDPTPAALTRADLWRGRQATFGA